jgi:CheY-like chemotaxis protein
MITEPFEQLLTLLTGATSQAFSLGPPQFDRLDAVIARMRGMLHQFAADLYPGESPEDAASIRKILELAQPRHRMPAAIARQSPAAIARQPPVAKPATPAAAPVAPVVPVAPVAPARAQPERETPTAPAAPAPAPALRADTAIPISTSGRDALASIESQLNALAARPSDQRAAAQLRRLLRIATENARARGAALLGEHLHDMESRAQGPGIYDPPSPQAIAQLKASLQKAAVLFEQSETARHPAPALETEIQLMPDDGPGTTPDLWGWNAPAPAVAPEVAPAVPAAMPAPAGRSAPAAGGQPDRSSENPESAGATKPATPTVETRADTADTARARAQAPGALLQADVEDRLAAARSALADLSSALQRLRESGRELKESTPASSAGVPVPDDVDIADVMQALSASIDEAAIAQSGLMQALEPASVAPTAGLARETSAPEPGARESVHASAPVTHPESVAVAPASETPESAAADPATDSANAPANPGNDPPLVMIVDDSLTVRRAARRFLERNGYAALEARDGRQALDYLASKQPDVVLIDIDMPDMNGFALLQQLRAEPRTRATAAVMIDTRLESKNRQLSLDHGANDYLVKPYQEQDLLGALGRCLTRPLE